MKLKIQSVTNLGLLISLVLSVSMSSPMAVASPIFNNKVLKNKNMVVNGNFEQWNDGKPMGWMLVKGDYTRDTVMKIRGQAALRMCTNRNQHARWLNTQIKQRIKLNADTSYNLKLWMAKDGEGKVLIRIRPIKNGRVNAAGAVLNWSDGWSKFFAWTPISIPFHTGLNQQYELSIVQFGSPTEPVWIDHLAIEPSNESTTFPVAGEGRQFLLYSPPVMGPFNQQIVPKLAWANSTVEVTVAKDEYGAGILGLRALESLNEVDVALAGNLKGPNGSLLSFKNVTLRMIADHALLPITQPRPCESQHNIGWWITVKTGAKQPPGEYQGELQIIINGKTATTVPIIINVLPFSLPQPDITFLAYYNERYFPAGFLSDSLRKDYYRDMREHGMNSVTVYNNPDVNGSTVDLAHNQTYNDKYFHYKKLNKSGYKLTKKAVENRFNYGLNKVIPMIIHAGLGSPKHPLLWLFTKAGRYNWGGMPEQAMKKAIAAWKKHKSWPVPLVYVNDEPEGHPKRIAAARRVLNDFKKWNLSVKTVTANVPVDSLGGDYDTWIQLDRRLTPEMAQAARKKNAELWVYDCNMPTDNGVFTRDMFGFWAYRSGVRGVALWAYYDAKNWYYDAEGHLHGTNGQFGLSRICPSPTGPVPTVSWETTRMGVDDYCHAQLYSTLIKQANHRAKLFLEQAHANLSSAEITALKAEEKQLSKRRTKSDKPMWKPQNSQQKEGKRSYLAAQHLLREADIAEQVRKQLIESIPFGALATSTALPFMTANHDFYPSLGPGDPITAAADKRRALIPYIVRLIEALDSAPLLETKP